MVSFNGFTPFSAPTTQLNHGTKRKADDNGNENNKRYKPEGMPDVEISVEPTSTHTTDTATSDTATQIKKDALKFFLACGAHPSLAQEFFRRFGIISSSSSSPSSSSSSSTDKMDIDS